MIKLFYTHRFIFFRGRLTSNYKIILNSSCEMKQLKTGVSPWLSEQRDGQCFPNTTSILSPWRQINSVLLGWREWPLSRRTCQRGDASVSNELMLSLRRR